VATGAAAGNSPYVQVYDAKTGTFRISFYAYDPGFTGGVHVAVTKINGSPTIITAPGPGMIPLICLFDGTTGTLEHEFLAYEASATVGVNVAVGDVNGDGYPDIVTATASGNPHVKVFDGKAIATGAFNSANPDASLLAQFFAYGLNFNVGANIAVGDVNGDGYADIVTGASTGNPHVKVYSGKRLPGCEPAGPVLRLRAPVQHRRQRGGGRRERRRLCRHRHRRRGRQPTGKGL
jgi:hypothetical protein